MSNKNYEAKTYYNERKEQVFASDMKSQIGSIRKQVTYGRFFPATAFFLLKDVFLLILQSL